MMLSTRRDVAARRGFLVGLTPPNRLASGRTQHGQELVGSAEAARLQSRRRHGGERFKLLSRIGAQVDLGGWTRSPSGSSPGPGR
jgi:hypothetical protein